MSTGAQACSQCLSLQVLVCSWLNVGPIRMANFVGSCQAVMFGALRPLTASGCSAGDTLATATTRSTPGLEFEVKSLARFRAKAHVGHVIVERVLAQHIGK